MKYGDCKQSSFLFLLALLVSGANITEAREIVLKDPTGDDKGGGTYAYPTDPVYKAGSFDLKEARLTEKGSDVEVKIVFSARIEDPWDSKSWTPPGNGFSLQMVFIFFDLDHKENSGFKDGLPGLNVEFEGESFWEKAIIISPQGQTRIVSEVKQKAPWAKDAVVIPKSVRAAGKEVTAIVKKSDIGGLKDGIGIQVVVQSNEGYPDKSDVLTRKVNEYAGQHRFGGGSDYNCDPHVIDIVVSPANGGEDEAKKQYDALKFDCGGSDPDKNPKSKLPMVYK